MRPLRTGFTSGPTARLQQREAALLERAEGSVGIEPDSAYAWWRLAASLALSAIGGDGLWSADPTDYRAQLIKSEGGEVRSAWDASGGPGQRGMLALQSGSGEMAG